MVRVVFVTSDPARHAEVARLLAGIDVEPSRLGPSVPDGVELEATARVRAAGAFAQLGRPCFVESHGLELEGEPRGRGASGQERLAALGEPGFCLAYAGRVAVARVVVALAEAPGVAGVRVFLSELRGTIAAAPRGEGGSAWDRVFVPEAASPDVTDVRDAPYLDLADYLCGRPHARRARGSRPS